MNGQNVFSRRSLIIVAGAASLGALAGRATAAPTSGVASIKIYKDPGCGCCEAWVDHLKGAGFKADVEERTDMADLKERLGVPTELASCHTGVINGYVIEGHVPAADIKRLVATRPVGKGLAVPGMPVNSPGMEVPGEPNERYTVWLFQGDGKRTAFSQHGG